MRKIGRYDVISELGRGAMGIVYKASDPTIGREVALKVISLNATSDVGPTSPQQMFMREVRAAGRLAHPSIVTIHDAFDDSENQTSCIVMELVPGLTLEKMLNAGTVITTDQALDIIRQVAEGLDYAHRNRVIHRDLKPANILVTEDWRAKITDFGIAKVLAREGVARTVGIMGTPSFMSPEQVKGGEIDGRTDIFSLGIIMFNMLTRRKPFTGNTAAVMFQIVYEEPPATSTLNPQLTPALDYVVKRCLAKDREQRYCSARELIGDIEDLQQGRSLRSQAVAPAPAPAPPTPAGVSPRERTLPMPIPDLMKAVAEPTVERLTPPPPPTQYVAPQPPTPFEPRPATPEEAERPEAPVPTERTMARPIPGLMGSVSQPPPPHPAPPPSSPAPPATLEELGGPSVPVRKERTMARPIPGLIRAASQPPAPHSAPSIHTAPTQYEAAQPPSSPTPPVTAKELGGPSSPVPTERTMAMPIPELMRGASQPPAKGVVSTPPVASPVPVQPPKAAIPPPIPAAQAIAKAAVEPVEAPPAVLPVSMAKLIPVIAGGVGAILLVGAMWGYWKFLKARTPVPPPQVVTQTAPTTPPPVTAPTPVETPPPTTVETPTPPTPAEAAKPTPPVKTAAAITKKPVVNKPKPAAAPVPTPPTPQPQPVAVTPSPQPSPPTPSPEEIAKAEAARLAKIPRIVVVVFNFGFKEATLTFFTGGQTIFEQTFKGKKQKGGFLGLKGSYQGSYKNTITVPAGVSEVSIHVVSKEGEYDAVQTIKMPAPGGFVPTLAVEADSDHMTLNWQTTAATK